MLGGHGKINRAALLTGIPVLHELGLLNDLPGIAQKLHTFCRDADAPVVPLKDGNPKLTLQFFDGI
ncbi:hypothetical protein D3C81_1745240 [compost metagenome]